jgi:hypothetical protein
VDWWLTGKIHFKPKKRVKGDWIASIQCNCGARDGQVASLAFWLPLEIYQMETLGHPTFVIALRFKNIVAFAWGKMETWGLKNETMSQDA